MGQALFQQPIEDVGADVLDLEHFGDGVGEARLPVGAPGGLHGLVAVAAHAQLEEDRVLGGVQIAADPDPGLARGGAVHPEDPRLRLSFLIGLGDFALALLFHDLDPN